MIEIRTDSGISLDIAPDAEFEIEMSNPILENDRIPVAFSTSISFPPSETNRSVFGYLPAMLLPPSVTEVGATLLSGGIPLLVGTLVYDSLDEDGNLVYSFTEKTFDEGLDKKLYELDLPKSRQPGGWSPDQLVERVRNGIEDGIGAPVLYDPDGSVTKYHNLPFSDNYSRFTPCVSIYKLFSGLHRINFSSSPISSFLRQVFVLGLHKPFTGQLKGYGNSLSIADTLPDVSLLDLLQEICKMTCCFVFADGGSYNIVPFSSIGQVILDWDGKISDQHSFATEKATGYRFGYQHDGQNSCDELEEIITVDSFIDILAPTQLTAGEFARHDVTNDIYTSRRSSEDLGDGYSVGRCHLYFFDNTDFETTVNGESFDNVLSFRLIRNVPHFFSNSSLQEEYLKLAGQMSFPKDGEDRDSSIILGAFDSGQIYGKGIRLSDNGSDVQESPDLSIGTLYNTYHKEFASWLSKDRQVIDVDVDLSFQDISSFRLWHAVCVRNRLFLVKKLTLRLSVRDERILSSAELISL